MWLLRMATRARSGELSVPFMCSTASQWRCSTMSELTLADATTTRAVAKAAASAAISDRAPGRVELLRCRLTHWRHHRRGRDGAMHKRDGRLALDGGRTRRAPR